MSIRNHIYPGVGPRHFVRITTVRTDIRKIEAQLKDGGNIQISLFDVPSFFVWPKEGEYWIARQDGGYWKLENKFDNKDDAKVAYLNPGEAKIGAEIIKTPSGKQIVTVADNNYDWINLKLINGWKDVSTLSAGDPGYEYTKNILDEDYVLNSPVFSYQYNDLTKTFYFRGIIYNNEVSGNNKIAIIPNVNVTKPITGFYGIVGIKPGGILTFGNTSTAGETSLILNGTSIQIT